MTSSGSVNLSPAEELLTRPKAQSAAWIGQQRAVLRVNEGGNPLGAAYRRDRPDVINMTMSEQHSCWSQPISLDNLLDALLSVLPRVDNQALLAWAGRKQVAVGSERASGEPGYQHSALIGGDLPVTRVLRACVQVIENWSLGWSGSARTRLGRSWDSKGNGGVTTAVTTVRFAKFRNTRGA